MHEGATPDFQFWNNIFLLHYCSILTKHNKYFFQSLWRLWARSAEAAAWEVLHSPQVSVSQIQVVLSGIILDKTIRGGEAEEETAPDTGNSRAELSWQLMNDTNAPPPSHLQTRTENECKTWLTYWNTEHLLVSSHGILSHCTLWLLFLFIFNYILCAVLTFLKVTYLYSVMHLFLYFFWLQWHFTSPQWGLSYLNFHFWHRLFTGKWQGETLDTTTARCNQSFFGKLWYNTV